MRRLLARISSRIIFLLYIVLPGSSVLGGTGAFSLNVGSLLFKNPIVAQSESGFQTGTYVQPIATLNWHRHLPVGTSHMTLKLGYSELQSNPRGVSPLKLDTKTFIAGVGLSKEKSFQFSRYRVGLGLSYLRYSYAVQFYSIERIVISEIFSPSLELALITRISKKVFLSVNYGCLYMGEFAETIELVPNPKHEMVLSHGKIAHMFTLGISYELEK